MPSPGAPTSPSGFGEHFVTDALINRAATIYGGSNEIQRNIVGKVAFSRQGPLL
jgi:alkylation response protein AidB-like acyl-CoA dehydrogenase